MITFGKDRWQGGSIIKPIDRINFSHIFIHYVGYFNLISTKPLLHKINLGGLSVLIQSLWLF